MPYQAIRSTQDIRCTRGFGDGNKQDLPLGELVILLLFFNPSLFYGHLPKTAPKPYAYVKPYFFFSKR